MRDPNPKVRSSLLALTFLLLMAPAAFAQKGTVSIELHNASLRDFFKAIEQQTQYSFSYRDSELEGKPDVTVSVRNAELPGLLSTELAKAHLHYTLVDDKIVITPQTERNQDSITLKGKVTDKAGVPVIGASVLKKGTTSGVITDLDGNYSIQVRRGEELEFSSLGYVTYAYKVGRLAVVDITLEDDAELLEEAVAVGYGTTLRKNLTTSVATVKAENISKGATSNMSQMLIAIVLFPQPIKPIK